MLPPGLALRKEKEDLPRRAAALPSEAAVRTLAEDYNARVEAFWRRPQDPPAVLVGLVDGEDLVAGWRSTRPEPPPALPEPAAPRRRFRWPFRRQPGVPGRTRPHS